MWSRPSESRKTSRRRVTSHGDGGPRLYSGRYTGATFSACGTRFSSKWLVAAALQRVDCPRDMTMDARTLTSTTAALVLLTATAASGQYYQTDFPAEEFRARHAKVFEQIGATAVAVVQGMPQTEGFTLPRQHNTFYYLSGIETPGAYLLLDGRTKKVTHLPAGAQPAARSGGRTRAVGGGRRSGHADLGRRPGEAARSRWSSTQLAADRDRRARRRQAAARTSRRR